MESDQHYEHRHASLSGIAEQMPDPRTISKAVSRAIRKRMGAAERLSPEELKDARRAAANAHARRKAKRKRQRTSTRRNRASAKRKR